MVVGPRQAVPQTDFSDIDQVHLKTKRAAKEIESDIESIKNSCGIATQAEVATMFKKVREAAQAVQITAKKSQLAIMQSDGSRAASTAMQSPAKSVQNQPRDTEDDPLIPTATKSKANESTGMKRENPYSDLQHKDISHDETNKRLCLENSLGPAQASSQPMIVPLPVDPAELTQSQQIPSEKVPSTNIKYIQDLYPSSPVDHSSVKKKTAGPQIDQATDNQSEKSNSDISTQTNRFSMSIEAAKMAQKLEHQMLKYPKARVMSLESQLAKEKEKRLAAEKDLHECRNRLQSRNEVHGEVIMVNRQIEKMAGQIADQLVPQNELVIHLKNHIASLHQRLGASPIQAEFHTLVEAREYDYLGNTVSLMIADGNGKASGLKSKEGGPIDSKGQPTSKTGLQVEKAITQNRRTIHLQKDE